MQADRSDTTGADPMREQDHLIILDDGVVTWTSESLGQWLGSQWWRGHRLEDVLNVDQHRVVQESSVDAVVNDPTGHTRPVRLNALPLTGDDKRDLVAVTVRPTEQVPTTAAEIAELASRFRLLVENTADVVVHTIEGVLEWVSPSIEDLTGWTPQELIGTTTAHLWHPEDADIAIRQREATYAGEPSRGTLRLLRKDGRYIWLDVALKPYREADGRRGAVGSLRDVSDYVRVHQETEAQRARLQMLLDSMLEPHLLLQAVRDDRGVVCDFAVVMANPAAASRLRARVDDLLDLRVSHVFTHTDTDQIVARLADWLQAGEPVVLNDWQARAQGIDAYFDISISVLEDQLMVAWRDVTQRHETASQLQASEEAYRLLTENAADLILRLDAANRVVWVSPSSHRLLGYLPENLLGGFRWDMVHEDDRQPLRAVLDLLRHGDQSVTSLEVRLRHRHGPYAWWALNARRTRDDPTSSEIVIALSNIDAQKRQNLELEREQAQRAAALQSMLDPHVLLQSVIDESGAVVDFRYADANEAACSYMGMARDDLVGSTVLGLLPAHADTGLLDLYRRTLSTGEPLVLNGYAYPHEILGQTRRFDIRGVRIGDSLSFTWRDVTEQHEVARRLAESQEKYRLLAENATDVVFRTDTRGIITFASEGVERLLGYTPQQVEGAAAIDYVHRDDRAAVDGMCTTTGRIPPVRARLRTHDGSHIWGEVRARGVTDDSGQPAGLVGGWRDVTAEVEIQRKLREQARTDSLSGLLNRREVLDRLDVIMSHPPRTGTRVAVAFVDVDGLKSINDSRGHAAGNAVIRTVAERLRTSVRTDDLVARIGGDEILLVLPGMHSLQEALATAETLRDVIARPLEFTGPQDLLHTTVSIGVTLTHEGDSPDTVIARADQAMYEAKRHGNRVAGVV